MKKLGVPTHFRLRTSPYRRPCILGVSNVNGAKTGRETYVNKTIDRVLMTHRTPVPSFMTILSWEPRKAVFNVVLDPTESVSERPTLRGHGLRMAAHGTLSRHEPVSIKSMDC